MKECPACHRCFPDHIQHCPNDGDPLTQSLIGDPVLDGRYLLEQRLGQGGMGIVFKARHNFLKTAHAIKIILPDLIGNDPSLVTRFRGEAMAAAAIRHQNVIAVTDFGVVRDKMPFLVMEFIKGRSLHDILAREGRLPPQRALEIISAVAAGVSAAHRQGIVHRDLKPLNIMIQDDVPINEGVKVLDFGLAKIKGEMFGGSFVAAQTTGLMGSPFYMAPEQWGEQEPDGRTDIYSMGIVLYQMLAGDVPFKGPSLPSIMKKHLTSEPPPLAALGAHVPPEIEAVVRHALEKEPGNRPQTVEQLISELRDAVAATSLAPDRKPLATVSIPSETMRVPAETRPLPQATSDQLAGTISTETVEAQRREAAEARRQAEAARARAEIERQRAEEEARRRAEEEAQRKRAQEEEAARRKAEEEARRQAEEEMRRRAEEAAARRRAAEEAEARRREEERRQAEAEAARRIEAERRRAEELARQRAAEEEARRKKAAEEEERRRVEALARQRAEEERRAQEEAARRRALEQEAARQRAEEEERQRRAAEERLRREAEERAAQARAARETDLAATTALKQTAIGLGAETQRAHGETTQAAPDVGPRRDGRAAVQTGDVSRQGSAPVIELPEPPGPIVPVAVWVAVIAVVILIGAAGAYFAIPVIWPPKPPVGPSPTPPSQASPTPPPPEKPRRDMVAVGGGTFMMGRDDVFPSNRSWDLIQYPAHPVSIKSFFIDRTEVTNAEYAEFVREAKHPAPPGWVNDQPPAGQEQFPVTMVSLEDAQAFARWLSARDKVTYRLPTEEEWEYAARGSNKDNIYPWGKQWIEGRANIGGTGAPRPVGSFPDGKSVWGVLDMIGNVWEWTSSEASIYPGNINLSLFNAERGVDDRGKIVLRGGSYDSKVTGDEAVTATSRLLVEKTRKHKSLGFRLVREGA